MTEHAALQGIQDVVLYAPDLENAAAFYQQLGLLREPDEECQGEARCVRLRFPDGGPGLVLHDDARRQFTDVELRVPSVRSTYLALAARPEVSWIRTPFESERGWQAILRGPDRNVFVIVSND